MKQLRNKGQSSLAFTIAATAITLYITAIVISKLGTTAEESLASSTSALQGVQNVSQYVWIGITLGAIGILVLAGMSVMGMISGGRR